MAERRLGFGLELYEYAGPLSTNTPTTDVLPAADGTKDAPTLAAVVGTTRATAEDVSSALSASSTDWLRCTWSIETSITNENAYYGSAPCCMGNQKIWRCHQRLERKLNRVARQQAWEEERSVVSSNQERQSSQSAGNHRVNGLSNNSTEKDGNETTVGSPDQESQNPLAPPSLTGDLLLSPRFSLTLPRP